jgi:FlaA1/EpsC-like NDP-sugar epimerase
MGGIVASLQEVILAMQEAAPAGREDLTERERADLQSLTQVLMAARADAVDEVQRFVAIRSRGIALRQAGLADWLRGRTVLVTGGTGCIGSTLMTQLARLGPGRLVSVSRGATAGWPRLAQAEYLRADIADRAGLAAVFRAVRPEVVFHVAAQRDPGLAERDVILTVRSNVLGTRNVVEACAEAGVAELISASTGKALRPYSREVYTASKRSAEWILAAAGGAGPRISASRFTHVVDNSIVYDRLLSWSRAGVVRLHDPSTLFYAQSALESAQLMLCAGTAARVDGGSGTLRVYAIADLGWPVSLLDLALGVLQRAGSQSPVYFSGHDPGYERAPFPALYDPATAGDISPLLSAFEAIYAEHDPDLGIDASTVRLDLGQVPADLLDGLEHACRSPAGQAAARDALDELSWRVLDAALAALPQQTLRRAERLAALHEGDLSCDHARMLAAISRYARPGQPATTMSGVTC